MARAVRQTERHGRRVAWGKAHRHRGLEAGKREVTFVSGNRTRPWVGTLARSNMQWQEPTKRRRGRANGGYCRQRSKPRKDRLGILSALREVGNAVGATTRLGGVVKRRSGSAVAAKSRRVSQRANRRIEPAGRETKEREEGERGGRRTGSDCCQQTDEELPCGQATRKAMSGRISQRRK